jgi:hypothetical protein
MELKSLDVISNGQKIHYLLLLLPLITFIFYKFSTIIISLYVIVVALMSLYIHVLIAFKTQSTNSTLYQKEKKINEFWYIPYIWIFVILVVVSLFAFAYSFIFLIINLSSGNDYNYFLFLAHLFVLTFDIFMLIIMRYYRNLIPKLKKQGKIKDEK